MRFLLLLIVSIFTFFTICSSPTAPKPVRQSITILKDTVWAAKGTYNISQDICLKAFLSIGDSSTVHIDSGVTLAVWSESNSAILKIGKGTKLYFGKGSHIDVGFNYGFPGTLIANGSPNDSILFTNDSNSTQWGYDGTPSNRKSGGIRIGKYASNLTSLNYCIIEKATVGISLLAGIYSISNNSIRNNIHEGVVFVDAEESGNYHPSFLKDSSYFRDNSISNNGSYPIIIGAGEVGNLSLSNNLLNNSKNSILILGSFVSSKATWKFFSCPYLIKGPIEVSAPLIISPKCRLEFSTDNKAFSSYIRIGTSGSLTAIGNITDSIYFTRNGSTGTWGFYGSTPTWDNIPFYGGGLIGQHISLRYCVIEFAIAGISSHGGAKISNTLIRNCSHEGFIGYPFDSLSFIENTITGNGSYPIVTIANYVRYFARSGNYLSNVKNGFYIYGSDILNNAVWQKQGVPYFIDNCLNISTSTLTISPGCILKFTKPNSYIGVGINNQGSLIAQGTPNDSIYFSKADAASWWGYSLGGIYIGRNATATALQYCDISQSTTGIYLDANAFIQNCTIHNNKYYGIDIGPNGSNLNVQNNSFNSNLLGDIHK